jgi:hypothetical protein
VNKKFKPILSLDFDGVIHSYSSGWKGADIIPDEPVEGAMQFIWDATEHFRVCIFSSRSNQPGGKSAMQAWVKKHFMGYWGTHAAQADDKLSEIEWPTEKPPALVTLDDRAVTFTGVFPSIDELRSFKPWNKREASDVVAETLLAEAAPDLLAACKAMLRVDSETRYSAREFVEAKELMAAAVAKAEGRP